MAAPAPPVINARCDGYKVRVFWRPVDTATDYNVYYSDELAAAGIEAQLDSAIDISPSGWFHYTFVPEGSIIQVYVTSLNIGAEESAASNVKGFRLA
jgi:hypothetical protein